MRETIHRSECQFWSPLVHRKLIGFKPIVWREKEDSITKLQSIFQAASTIGGMTQASKLHTQYGLKDTFQDFFTQKIFSLTRSFRGNVEAKQQAIDNLLETFPTDVMSPVWRIKGICPIPNDEALHNFLTI